MPTKASETLGQLFVRVLRPLLRGEPMFIGRPFGSTALQSAAELAESVGWDRWPQEAGHLLTRLRSLAVVERQQLQAPLDREIVMLAAHLHDACAVFHEDLRQSRAASRLLAFVIASLEAIPCPHTARSALLRHAWLGNWPGLRLRRTKVQWWTGSASFVGQPPPGRLLAWPELRRVRREERVAPLLRATELFDDEDSTQAWTAGWTRVLAAFFAASPLSDVCWGTRPSPPMCLTPALVRLSATPVGIRLVERAIQLSDEPHVVRERLLGLRGPPMSPDAGANERDRTPAQGG